MTGFYMKCYTGLKWVKVKIDSLDLTRFVPRFPSISVLFSILQRLSQNTGNLWNNLGYWHEIG